MSIRLSRLCLVAVVLVVRTMVCADGFLAGGRDYDEKRDAQIRITGGIIAEIDAGAPSGVIQYMNPQEDFVVGGQADGVVGLGLPELGLGGQLRIGSPGAVNLVLQGRYAILQYDGDMSYFTSSRHREKNVDIDHFNARVSCALEFPLASGSCITLAAQYQLIESEAAVTSKDATTEEIIARRERFDKDVDFTMGVGTAMLGMTFQCRPRQGEPVRRGGR